ncbi:uncharacterized protein LOC133518340 [Cydia pomonella]|uniref:uncharacterized protein LOC133518340 n=1 Tax=Cydia pomonella TaxID=82600 RepID=UPI002ADE59D1|nr:uncharacterized protein LOC133518340 [Cydia pomonella]
MSPLARSLLALAALLATADAECVTKEVGHKTEVPISIGSKHLSGQDQEQDVVISDYCKPSPVLGETVRVCSHVTGCVPTIDIGNGQYSPAKVGCNCPDGCELDGTQYC